MTKIKRLVKRSVRRLLSRYAQMNAWLVLRVRRPLVIGVTGSVGKTTTVQMLATILHQPNVARRLGAVGVTINNMNDAWGLPLTVLGSKNYFSGPLLRQLPHWLALPVNAAKQLASRDFPAVLILEFGAGTKGHLHELARLVRPRVGVVTSIGESHLARLGGITGVVQEKSALVSSPPADGAVILGGGHPYVDELARRARAPVQVVEGVGFDLNRNIARAVARELGVSEAEIEAGLRVFSPGPRRLHQERRGPFTVIDDTHNANPLSMKLGLDTLAATAEGNGRRVAVLGPMAELGPKSASLHNEVGAHAHLRADLVVGVGPEARAYEPDIFFPDVKHCAAELGNHLKEGDCILFKASNGIKLWEAIDAVVMEPDAGGGSIGAPLSHDEHSQQHGDRARDAHLSLEP